MSVLQRRLSEFLELELHHSLGAYRHAGSGLLKLQGQMDLDDPSGKDAQFLKDLTRQMVEYNEKLDKEHDNVGDTRHPPPDDYPLSGKEQLWWVGAFYEAAVHAIDHGHLPAADQNVANFQTVLVAPRSEFLESRLTELAGRLKDDRSDIARKKAQLLRDQRKARFGSRIEYAAKYDIPKVSFEGDLDDSSSLVQRVMETCLEKGSTPERLGEFVLKALAEAHLTMHKVEAEWSVALGDALAGRPPNDAEGEPSPTVRLLHRSIALNTFVLAATRCAPWMFAEDATERDHMVAYYGRAWRTNMPLRAMWITAQTGLLALHRRAFARTLLGEHTAAYKDFHKLQRHVRETRRRVQDASVHVDGAIEFLEGIEALADHHIGELYRRDRDHTSALRYYHRSNDRLKRLKSSREKQAMTNSRWFVNLQLSLGKSSFELGRHKAALAWYIRTWAALLDLMADDAGAEVSTEQIDAALAWLDGVIDEPILHKGDVITYMGPVVDQLADLRVDPRYCALASKVVLRLGHLLFLLNLPSPPANSNSGGAPYALTCIRRARQLDNWSTLAMSDLLKLDFRATRNEGEAHAALENELQKEFPAPREHWPGGSSEVEGLSRVVEYVLLVELRSNGHSEHEHQEIARELLNSLLTHTDSIEARKSQVYEYLSRPSKCSDHPGADRAALEFVCLRRYSSAYPILPRPQGFRADGGGYFVRICPENSDGRAFGIVVDPGTSYVECLYRAGYSLADIDMIIVTHDDVDHASSFEPLMSVRHEMHQLARDPKPLMVAGNESVILRWRKIWETDKAEDDKAEDTKFPVTFHELAGTDSELELVSALVTERVRALAENSTATVSIEALRSDLNGSGSGHNDRARNPSIGVLIEVGASADVMTHRSLAITSDLPSVEFLEQWPEKWTKAIAADVLVCHLSSTPLAELRKLSGFTPSPDTAEAINWVNEQYDAEGNGDVRARFNYSYGLGYKEDDKDRTIQPVGDAGLENWTAVGRHLYLRGLLRVAKDFREAKVDTEATRLLVIGELSEELGSFRSKIASQLNVQTLNSEACQQSQCRAVTADIGLHILLVAGDRDPASIRVLCSTCELDNDLAPVERFHGGASIHEVCVKGENEGIFYNCSEHDPSQQQPANQTFIERHERYDVFGR